MGHDIKSRAANTTIENSRIDDPNGTGSYEIDLPNGGNAVIENNVIEKGADAGNANFISFGEEGGLYANSSLNVTGNTLINDDGVNANLVVNDTTVAVSVTGNTAYGLTSGQLVSGPVSSPEDNTLDAQSSEPALDTSAPYLPVLPFSFACFAAGTHILTTDGEVPVEALRIGQDVVVVRSGEQSSGQIRSLDRPPIYRSDAPSQSGARPADTHPRGRVRRGRAAARSADFARSCDLRRWSADPGAAAAERRHHRARTAPAAPCGIFMWSLIGTTFSWRRVCQRRVISTLETAAYSRMRMCRLLLHPDLSSGNAQARRQFSSCAPFAADAERVEPVWRRLAVRASELGFVVAEPATTTDPALRLLVDGRECWPVAVTGDRHVFVLPRSAASVRLISRASAPCDIAPWIEDQRRLGVAVGRIVLTGSAGPVEMVADHPSLADGWWAAERDGSALWRWTNGNAVHASAAERRDRGNRSCWG